MTLIPSRENILPTVNSADQKLGTMTVERSRTVRTMLLLSWEKISPTGNRVGRMFIRTTT